jgi:hypothetical protein
MTRSAPVWLCVAALVGCSGGGGTSTVPGDTTAPTVLNTTPSAGATSVAASTAVSVQFSEPMRLATVAVTLTPSAALGTPVWTAGDTVVSFMPTSALAAGTTYTVAISAQDMAGNPLAFPGLSFTTATATALAGIWDASIWDQGLWQ